MLANRREAMAIGMWMMQNRDKCGIPENAIKYRLSLHEGYDPTNSPFYGYDCVGWEYTDIHGREKTCWAVQARSKGDMWEVRRLSDLSFQFPDNRDLYLDNPPLQWQSYLLPPINELMEAYMSELMKG